MAAARKGGDAIDFSVDLSEEFTLDLGLIENLISDSTPDVSFQLASRRGF